jgi:hypothetical protein
VLTREIARPSALNPAVPPQVDAIVLHALERDVDKRLQSAAELRQRLEDALRTMGQAVSEYELGAWMRHTFADAYAGRMALERRAFTMARMATANDPNANFIPTTDARGTTIWTRVPPLRAPAARRCEARRAAEEPVWSVDEATITTATPAAMPAEIGAAGDPATAGSRR